MAEAEVLGVRPAVDAREEDECDEAERCLVQCLNNNPDGDQKARNVVRGIERGGSGTWDGDRSGESGIPGLRGAGAGRGRTTVATYAPTESTDDFFFSRPSRIS